MFTWELIANLLRNESIGSLPTHLICPQAETIETDSRSEIIGKWFLPLKGELFDGHDFIETAVSNGVAGFFCEKHHPLATMLSKYPNVIWVRDSLSAYQLIAKGWREAHSTVKIAALTGSVGKTTTKSMVGTVLNSLSNSLPFDGNFNNEVGIPLSLLKIRSEHKFGVLEIGARHVGDIAKLTPIIAPNTVACLNVGHSHLGEFGSKEKIYQTKLEIFSSAPAHATLVAYYDDPIIKVGALQNSRQKIFFGKDPAADIRLVSTRWTNQQEMIVELNCFGKIFPIHFKQGNEAYGINAAAATAICYSLGLDFTFITQALANFKSQKGRYHVITKSDYTVVDDTYNANLDSMKAGLSSFATSFSDHSKVVVLGDMLELGEISQHAHEEVGTFCAKIVNPQYLITVGERAKSIANSAISSGMKKNQVFSFDHIDQLLQSQLPLAKLGTAIYAKASNGMQLKKLIERIT